MFIIPSIDLSMKLSLSEVFVLNIIVTMVISNKSCCKHVLFTNLSDFISTTTRVTSVKSKKFLFCSFSVAKFGIAPGILPWSVILPTNEKSDSLNRNQPIRRDLSLGPQELVQGWAPLKFWRFKELVIWTQPSGPLCLWQCLHILLDPSPIIALSTPV